MHILVVSQYFWPETFRINDLVKELMRRGHQVTVLTGIPNYPSGKVFEIYKNQPDAYKEYEGARVVRVPILPRGNGRLRLVLNYLSFVVNACFFAPLIFLGRRFDVIFVYEPSPITVGLPAIWISKIKRAPIVFWVLDLWPETIVALGVVRSPRILYWLGWMVSFIYNRCTLILGQSHAFLTSIALYCGEKDKIRYFPNWIDEKCNMLDIVPAPEIPVWTDGFTVVFTGNIGEAQDMPAVLDAAEKLKNNSNIRWIIVGDGSQFDWLRSEIISRGLDKQVLLPGGFPVERMPSFYAHANALLVSLKREPVFSMTIPGKVQSYLTTGIPLLGMLDGEGASIIREAQAGLVCQAGQSTELVDAVLTMAAMSSKKRKQLGINGRRYAQQEFGCIRLMNYLESMLKEAVTTNRTKCLREKR